MPFLCPVNLTITLLPSLTHLSLSHFIEPGLVPISFFSSFPALISLTITELSYASLSQLAAALVDAPPSLVRFATTDSLPAHFANALPATVSDLTFGPKRGSDLRLVMSKWFSGRSVGEVGRLRRVVVAGLMEDELVRYYARGAEFLETVAGAGCEIECR